MKRFLLLALLVMSASVYAETTSNLITNTWNNVTNGSHPNDCCTGGPSPLYDASTNTIHFSYGLTAVHQVQAINNALSGSGVQINGWNWGYDLRNMNGVGGNQNGTDSIAVTSFITNSVGHIVQQSDQHYNTQFDWTRYAGTVNLNNALSDYGSLGIQFVANDGGYWAGYYGPQVRNVSLTAKYTVDQCVVNPQSSPTCAGYRTYYNMSDDGHAVVPLPFAFPFYGQVFTTSYMYTNGVVGFLNNNWGFCCDGTDLNQQASQQNSPWNYAIYALNTDLYPGANSTFYTQKTDNGTGLRYTWDKVVEIGTNLENTFSVNIKNTGYIGLTYESVNLNSYRNPLIGIAGDISKGEFSQYYFGQASALPNLAGITLTFTGTETTDVCIANPLFSTSCAGYAVAYHNQQCSINPLYDTTCSGYAAAYYSQQCSINSLYDPGCPGFAAAYLNYQCNLSQLYSTSCPGYEQAYLEQQCSISPLYSNQCTGYQAAVTECSANPLSHTYCPSYEAAVTDCSTNGLLHSYCPSYTLEIQLCTTDPLSNTLCTGYSTAVNSCNSNQLLYTYCPSYTTTLAACSSNSQSNTLCPGYSTASSNTTNSQVVEAKPEVKSDGTVSTTVSSTGNSTVDTVIESKTTSTTSPTATVQLAPTRASTSSPTQTAQTTAQAEQKKETKQDDMAKQETKKDEPNQTASASTQGKSDVNNSSGEKKPTARQEIAAKRAEARKQAAVEAGKKAAESMDKATSFEAQTAVQNVVIAAMGFTPGFNAYNIIIPDVPGYKPFEIYKNQKTVDNARTMRFMSARSDKLHEQMVDAQWENLNGK